VTYSHNSGVHIGGSSYGPVAAGANASAVQHGGGATRDDLVTVLEALAASRLELDRHRAAVPEAGLAERDLARTERELREPDPDPDAVDDALNRVLRRVAGVGSVAAAVTHLRALAEALWR
jgi:hypothetical protein